MHPTLGRLRHTAASTASPVRSLDTHPGRLCGRTITLARGLHTAPKTRVVLYNGPGAADFCVKETRRALQQHATAAIQVTEFQGGNLPSLDPKRDVVILPGGYAPTQHQALMPVVRRLISVNVLATCSGAYALCAHGSHTTARGLRFLSPEFYDRAEANHPQFIPALPVLATGPLRPQKERITNTFLHLEIRQTRVGDRIGYTPYWLGPWFPRPESLVRRTNGLAFTTIATLDDPIRLPAHLDGTKFSYNEPQPPIVIQVDGAARTILSGCHPYMSVEALTELLKALDTGLSLDSKIAILRTLSSEGSQHHNDLLMRDIFERLGIPLNASPAK